MDKSNWKVRLYDASESITEEYTIVNRTEREAVREAETDPDVRAAETWSITKQED